MSKHVGASNAKASPEDGDPATAEATAGSSSRPGGEAAEHSSSSNAKRDREDNEVVGGTRARTQRDATKKTSRLSAKERGPKTKREDERQKDSAGQQRTSRTPQRNR